MITSLRISRSLDGFSDNNFHSNKTTRFISSFCFSTGGCIYEIV